MKKFDPSTTIGVFILMLILALTSYLLKPFLDKYRPTTSANFLLIDVTDSNLVMPVSQDIISLYGLQNDKWNGAVFSLSNISQVSLNKTTQNYIEQKFWLFNNDFERDKEVLNFENSIKDIIEMAYKEPKGRDHSTVYLSIANALNKLEEFRLGYVIKKRLLVYSDLMENNPTLSFYNPAIFNILISNPSEIDKIFEDQMSINSLSDTEVYLIYQPKDIVSDQRYRVIAAFYKNMLERKGAKVYISPNLNP